MKITQTKGFRQFLITNAIFALFLLNIFVLSRLLELSPSFVSGIFTGFFSGWVIYLYFAIRELRHSKFTYDERMKHIHQTACTITFWITLLAAEFLGILAHAQNVEFPITVKQLSILLPNFMFLLYGIIFLILWRRH